MYLRSYLPDLSGVPSVHLRGVPAREDPRVVWSVPSVPHAQSLAGLSGFSGRIILRRFLVQPVLGGTVQNAVNVAITSGDPFDQPHIPSSRVARRRVLSE